MGSKEHSGQRPIRYGDLVVVVGESYTDHGFGIGSILLIEDLNSYSDWLKVNFWNARKLAGVRHHRHPGILYNQGYIDEREVALLEVPERLRDLLVALLYTPDEELAS